MFGIWLGSQGCPLGPAASQAAENLAEVLKQRSPELPPAIQMCDALSRNVPKVAETLVANCTRGEPVESGRFEGRLDPGTGSTDPAGTAAPQ